MQQIPIVLAHGAVGPLDEILPPVLLGGILGLIVITWWNGRKASSQPPPADTTASVPPIESPASDPNDGSHFPVN